MFPYGNYNTYIGSSNAITRILRTFSKNSLNFYKANVFDPQHLQGARLELVQSMFKIGWKAAELERTKLQSEIQRQQSELRQKHLEKWLKMSSGRGTKGGCMKSLKQEDNDDDSLEDLVVDSNPKKPKKPATYLTLKPGGFVTKAEDQKG